MDQFTSTTHPVEDFLRLNKCNQFRFGVSKAERYQSGHMTPGFRGSPEQGGDIWYCCFTGFKT